MPMIDHDDFDKQFNRMQKFAAGWMIFWAVVVVGVIAALIIVGVKVLQHFGIL